MDIDRIYQIMGSALKRVYGFYVKRPLQRFNVDNRAEKVFENEKTVPKAAPRHERTDQLFKQITQSNPQFKKELNERREDLLQRLTAIRVVSKERQFSEEELLEMEEIKQRVKTRLPQSRQGTDIPIHAYVEPPHVPIGRISLLRALDFIGKHAKDPQKYDSESIAKQHSMKNEDIDNILEYFKPFYRDEITDPVEDTEKVLGLSKDQMTKITSYLKPKSYFEPKEQIKGSSDDKSTTDDRQESQRFNDKKV